MRLIPRDEQFFPMFGELAKRMTASTRLLCRIFADPQRLAEQVSAIKALEHEADDLTQEIVKRLDATFVTPLDREDIHLLASRLDDVIDLIDGTARRAAMFHIAEPNEFARRLCDVLTRAADCVAAAVVDMKKPRVVAERAREVKKLEEEGDAVYSEAVASLFRGRPDVLEVIKWKEIYDTIEHALDECEDVSNVLGSISLKNA